MVTMQQIRTLLNQISDVILAINVDDRYHPTVSENKAHFQLIDIFWEYIEKYPTDTELLLAIGIGSPLPNYIGQQFLYVDELYKVVQQYYDNLIEHKKKLNSKAEYEHLAQSAPWGWKETVNTSFKKLLFRALNHQKILNQTVIDDFIQNIQKETKFNSILVRSEIESIIRRNNLSSPFSLDRYCELIAVDKVTRAVTLASAASGTLATKDTTNLNMDKKHLVNKLLSKQLDVDHWKKPAYNTHFFSAKTAPVFVKAYNNPGAIKSAVEYLRLRLGKHQSVYIKYALQGLNQIDYVEKIQTIVNSSKFTSNPDVQLRGLDRLWKGLLKESDLKFKDPIDQVITMVCLQRLYFYFEQINNGSDNPYHIEATYDLLSLLIANVLRINGGLRKADNYYETLFSDRHPKVSFSQTVSAKKGKQAYLDVLTLLMDSEEIPDTITGFPLPSVYNDLEYGYFEIVGSKIDAKQIPLRSDDRVRFLGRNSETCYQIQTNIITQLKKELMRWCQTSPGVLVLDITIEKNDDELIDLLNSKEVQHLIGEGKLQVILFKSEQKQQSLGTGKFSAGSACLIANQKKVRQFDEHYHPKIYDYNLSGFYRQYTSDITLELIRHQTETANKLAAYIKFKVPKACIIANGPFILIGKDSVNSSERLTKNIIDDDNFKLQELCRNTWPLSGSFGFAKTTYSQWDFTMLRISVGIEPIEKLIEEFDLEYNKMSERFEPFEEKNDTEAKNQFL